MSNPFTGASYGGLGATGNMQDFTFLPNGQLVGYTLPGSTPNADADLSYSYVRVSSETGAITPIGPSGIQTFEVGLNQAGVPTVVASDDGFQVQGVTIDENFGGQGIVGFMVGNRPNDPSGFGNPRQNAYFQNIVYAFNPQNGLASGLGTPDRQVRTFGTLQVDDRANGAGTQVVERGFIETGTAGAAALGIRLVLPTGASLNTAVDNSVTPATRVADAFTIQAGGVNFRLEFDAGLVLDFATDADTRYARDGDQFTLTRATGPTTYEFDSGPVVVIDAATLEDGATVRVADSAGTIRTFEFNSNNLLRDANAISVPFTPLPRSPVPSAAQVKAASSAIATALANAVTAASQAEDSGFLATGFATPGQGRVDLVNDSAAAPVVSARASMFLLLVSFAFRFRKTLQVKNWRRQ
jgi:hypothetical protein